MSFILLGILNSQAAGGGSSIPAYDLLATTVVSTPTNSISFTGLDNYTDYKHLELRFTVQGHRDGNLATVKMRFNNITTADYSRHFLEGGAGGIDSRSEFNTDSIDLGRTPQFATNSKQFASFDVSILDFHSNSKNKTIRYTKDSAVDTPIETQLGGGALYSTSPLTSIQIFTVNRDCRAGSTFSLYGIKG